MVEFVENPGAEYYSPARKVGELLKKELENEHHKSYFYQEYHIN